MNGRRKFLALGTLLAAPNWAQLNADGPRAAPRQSSLPLAIDLAADSRMASERSIPLLVLYSLPGCPHCEAVRRSYLLPLLAESTPRVLVRQIDVDSSRQLMDFQKRAATHQAFATREGITLTPRSSLSMALPVCRLLRAWLAPCCPTSTAAIWMRPWPKPPPKSGQQNRSQSR